TDNADSLGKRQAARGDHLARLHQLQSEGRLLTAGPFPAIDSEEPGEAGFTGSLIIARFDSLEDAPYLGCRRTLSQCRCLRRCQRSPL
ncbi:YCII-related domain protein, partial [Acidithiobacillus sp. GGI-221]